MHLLLCVLTFLPRQHSGQHISYQFIKSLELIALTLFNFDLFLCPTQSQEDGVVECEHGWFGPSCHYKCRCTKEQCDKDGVCGSGAMCLGGWFGPACQYADVAYLTSSVYEATDGNDTSCVNPSTVLSISVPIHFPVTWFRVHFYKSDVLDKFTFDLKGDNSSLAMNACRSATVDDKTLDIQCADGHAIQELVFSGEGARYLCTVSVSGGRNLALKQLALQSSTYTKHVEETGLNGTLFGAELAVDGDRNRRMLVNKGCSHTAANSSSAGVWNVTLPPHSLINRYTLYNREEQQQRLVGFKLQSFNEKGFLVYSHRDTLSKPESIYNLSHANAAVKVIEITTSSIEMILTLCEVEVYGDSNCSLGLYGRECSNNCSCKQKEPCFVSTGGCPSGCADGYTGFDCQTQCPRNTYGENCNFSCSTGCSPMGDSTKSTCHYESGVCFNGCNVHYKGLLCNTEHQGDLYVFSTRAIVAVTIPLAFGLLAIIFVLVYCIQKYGKDHTEEEY